MNQETRALLKSAIRLIGILWEAAISILFFILAFKGHYNEAALVMLLMIWIRIGDCMEKIKDKEKK
jgi:hypothetical protein